MLNATEIIRTPLIISIEKTEGAHPPRPPKTEGDFSLWRGIPAARAVFATAGYEIYCPVITTLYTALFFFWKGINRNFGQRLYKGSHDTVS